MISAQYNDKGRKEYTMVHSNKTGSGLYLTTAIIHQAYKEPLSVNL